MRLATEVAAMRLGWVWPMIWRLRGVRWVFGFAEKLGSEPEFCCAESGSDPNLSLPNFSGAATGFQLPLPSAKAILGSCVVLPDPVSPHTITTWCACMADMMSSRRALTGRSSGK